jgi:hypothetical protein
MHKTYLTPITGVECLADSIRKIADENLMAQQEVDMAAQQLETAKDKKVQTGKKNATDPRTNATIEGLDNPESIPPTEQPGAILPAEAPIDITRSWFIENFGMTGRELSEILVKARDLRTLDSIQPLLKMEKAAILKHFTGVSPSLVGVLPITDMDYDALNRNSERLDLPFRRFVKTWVNTDQKGKDGAVELWRTTVDKSERLSNRERNLLQKCKDTLEFRGALNAQTLKSYGIQASPAEISSIIKSHGFLYDLISVGQFSKSVGRGLFYDVRRRDVLLKDADRFIAGLIENDAQIKLDSRLNPRIEMRFYAPTAPWYADALNKAVGVESVSAEGRGLVIEGESAVFKALEMAEPYLNGHAPAAKQLLKGLRGDTDALVLIAYESMNPTEQVKLLKAYRIDEAKMEAMLNGR